VHSFEDIDTAPPVPLAAADTRAQLVAQEMLRFKQEVLDHYRAGRCADLASFWLRKTKKPVLAVLMVQKPGGDPVLYRGCNMEVSMPTGSLCAERNAIGSALAADLTLRRRDLKIVAVLSLSFKAAGATASSTAELQQQPPRRALDGAFAAVDAGPRNGQAEAAARPRMLLAAAAAAQLAAEAMPVPVPAVGQDGVGDVLEGSNGGGNGGLDDAGAAAPSPPRVTVIRSYSVKDLHHLHHAGGPGSRRGSLDVNDPLHAPALPLAPLALGASTSDGGGGEQHASSNGHHHHHHHEACSHVPATLTIAVDSEDLNPLKPCGACMEWLKKIAEKNPEFRVATFTDEGCRGIYTEFISTS
jgi:cytidine deaminase